MIDKFSNETIKALKFYVYVYSDPDTKKPFYVGKGQGNRVFQHIWDDSESEKVQKIKEIFERKKEPLIEILAHGLNEKTALKVEAAVIDLIGINNLTNQKRGYESSTYGKIEVSALESRYAGEKLEDADIKHNLMLIRINRVYRNDMTPYELYEGTRGCWKLSLDSAEKVDYVLSVYDGMVIEVYKPVQWFEGLTTFTTKDDDKSQWTQPRYEFVGRIADPKIRKKYVGKSVAEYFKKGDQNPIRYVWGK
ncbi:hypothetical protein [Ruminobacter sp. RM87]|uniref:LEM-3-like GIY-YIG domain-containing protein n=1 Tax=Ruminobacter sp. RM87 TaxID=1200567 RepID=UPI0004E0FDAB|nr:hypothetical protein [Ruminobacter sp. RM87]